MVNQDDIFKKVIAHSKEYGYVFQSSELYDGLAAVYDYGPSGSELKKNIKDYWWASMVKMNDNIVGIDSAIFMHPTTWQASGHLDAFNDPLIDNKDSKKRYRADVLVEDFIGKIESKIAKEVKKAAKRFGDDFNETEFMDTNPKVIRNKEKIAFISKRLNESLAKEDLTDIKTLIEELLIKCPVSGTCNWTDVRQFNLMFGTKMGAFEEGSSDLWLRPETAQGIFVNFLNVQKTSRKKIPFGIAQIGKAFRNEIVARQFIFRMREFEQMEMQFFVRPGEEMKWYNHWKKFRLSWHLSLGIDEKKFRFHDHEKLAHYANAATDIEFQFPFGFKEVEGIHSRTDFDLKAHQKASGRKLTYFDPEINESYTPFVIETSIGVDRMFLLTMCNAYREEILGENDTRIVLALPPVLAPVKAAILPLTKKNGMPELARKIFDDLKFEFNCVIEEKDSIGRRYRRQDANGTPFCITIDNKSINDNCVTIRDRDSMIQERVEIETLRDTINAAVSIRANLANI